MGGQINGSASDIVVDPSTLSNPRASQTVYAAIVCTGECTNGGVYKSVNGGALWTQLTNGIPTQTANMKLFVSNDGRTLYAASSATNGDDFGGFYISSDAGVSWHGGGALPSVGGSPDCLGTGQAGYNLAVGADPNNPSNVFFGSYRPL